MILDRCPQCGAAIAIHRLDIANSDAPEEGTVAYCYACRFDLRTAPMREPIVLDQEASELLLSACRAIDPDNAETEDWDLGRYAVLHQLSRIMTTRYKHVRLRAFVLEQIGATDISLTQGHVSFEMRSIEERHHLVQLVAWLLVDCDQRLTAAWKGGAVRYNVLLKDFNAPPAYYNLIAEKFSNWRDRFGA